MPARTGPPASKTSGSDAAFELKSLFEFSGVVNASFDIKFILGHFLLTLMGKLLSLRGIVLLARQDRVFSVECVKGMPGELVGTVIPIDKVPKRMVSTDVEDAQKMPWISFFEGKGIRLLVPLMAREKTIGIVGLAPAVQAKKLMEREETYLKSLANIAAAAIEKSLFIGELSQLNRKLDGKVQELKTLFELSKEFNAVLDPDRLVKLLLFSVMGQIGANRYIICLERDGSMEVVASRLDKPASLDFCAFIPTLTTPALVEEMTRKGELKWQAALKEAGITVLIPLLLQNKVKGMLALGEKMRGEKYTQGDMDFLFSLGNLAIISLENARLFKEAIEKQKLEDELLIAKEIQKGLLPAKLPSIENYDIAAVNISSKQVGGDYYDVIKLSQEHYVFAIGDVSGKGTPASLLMANLQATIRALVPLGLSLPELTKRVNDLLCENTGSDRFITFFWGILHAASGRMMYVNAGHNPPFLFHADGRMERLDRGGIILGIMKAVVPYQEGEAVFSAGDVLVLFTDGVSEAMNSKGEELGEEKLEEISRGSLCEPAADIVSRIVDAVKEHSRSTTQSDDITLLVVKSHG